MLLCVSFFSDSARPSPGPLSVSPRYDLTYSPSASERQGAVKLRIPYTCGSHAEDKRIGERTSRSAWTDGP